MTFDEFVERYGIPDWDWRTPTGSSTRAARRSPACTPGSPRPSTASSPPIRASWWSICTPRRCRRRRDAHRPAPAGAGPVRPVHAEHVADRAHPAPVGAGGGSSATTTPPTSPGCRLREPCRCGHGDRTLVVVVVGGGTAGCVVAARLERGRRRSRHARRGRAGARPTPRRPATSTTSPRRGRCGTGWSPRRRTRPRPYPQGRGLGGSSAVNGGVLSGEPTDDDCDCDRARRRRVAAP